MPFIHIIVGKPLSGPSKQRVCGLTTQLIGDLLSKRREVTSVLVESVASDGWCINGEPPADARTTPVHVDILITAGTNSSEEKSRMITAMHAMLGEELGALPAASYVVIRELPATDWGYAGCTQAARRQTGGL
ncbi:MAG: tautomerase family protein [Rhodocyclaceae bacterium]|nr:tautomerase family protein [Rhodocyclaceae bacterium]